MIKKNIANIFLQQPARPIMVGLAIGFIVSVSFMLYFGINTNEYWLLGIGALLGVVFQVLYEAIDGAVKSLRQLSPLRKLLGTLAIEDSWIYISAFRVNLKNSTLYRNDPNTSTPARIVGSEYVYGKGDALALSYLFHVLEKGKIGKVSSTVQDSEQTADLWGRSAICIGAHNFKTREIMTKFTSCQLLFNSNFTEIINRNYPVKINSDGIKFYRSVRKKNLGDGLDFDYGVILKIKDEYHPDKNILIVAGLGDMGTAGSAYFLYKHFDQLPYNQEEFGVLIEVPSGIESARKVEFDQVSKTYVSYE